MRNSSLCSRNKARRANGRSENARTVNQAIEKLTEKITGHYRHIRKSLGFVTAELVKNAVEGIGQKPFTLLALFREHNEEFRKRVGVDRKEETYESYENSYNILASFVKKRKEKEDVALRSLDREFYDDFEVFEFQMAALALGQFRVQLPVRVAPECTLTDSPLGHFLQPVKMLVYCLGFHFTICTQEYFKIIVELL